jgi:hypothetical protein
MATTETRTGFRLPWSSDRRAAEETSAPTDAAESASAEAGEAEGATAAAATASVDESPDRTVSTADEAPGADPAGATSRCRRRDCA